MYYTEIDTLTTLAVISGILLGFVLVSCLLRLGVILYYGKPSAKRNFNQLHLGFRERHCHTRVGEYLRGKIPCRMYYRQDLDILVYNRKSPLTHVVTIDACGRHWVETMYSPSHGVPVRVIGRKPHIKEEVPGYYSFLLPNHRDRTLHFYCPMYRLYCDVDLPASGVARLVVYPIVMNILNGERQEKEVRFNTGDGRAVTIENKGGMYSLWEMGGRDTRLSPATVWVSGTVLSHRTATNPITQRPFHVTTIDVGGQSLEIASRRRTFLFRPKPGNRVQVAGQLHGYFTKCGDHRLAPIGEC